MAGEIDLPKPIVLANAHFALTIDPANGSLASLSHPGDPSQMTWITSAANTPWQARSLQWGLGRANVGVESLHRGRWETPAAIDVEPQRATIRYRVGDLQIEVVRELADDSFRERYLFTNLGKAAVPLTHWAPGAFGLYWPFNDNYTTAEDCLERRAHAHIWCGGTTAWVCALRMGGRAPHLGLVLTEGTISAYSVTGRDMAASSNTRGVFIVHPAVSELAPGATTALGWTFFWHAGWDDFTAQCARRSPQFVSLTASRYTLERGEKVDFKVSARADAQQLRLVVGGSEVALRYSQKDFAWIGSTQIDQVGEAVCELATGTGGKGVKTHARLNVVQSFDEVVAARVRFIAQHQQVNRSGDPLDGAYLVYDNERDTLVRKDWGHDRNEGRERLAMGVLLARWLRFQTARDPALIASLGRYYRFVSDRLQKADGTVLNGVNDSTERLYNWPWVMQLHLEMARLRGADEPIDRFVQTVKRFYTAGGAKLYAIGVPVFDGLQLLADRKRQKDYDHVRALFVSHGERLAEKGTRYPPHEVNFEQSIVAPAAIFLLELYAATGEQRWLDAARPHLQCLELFGGRQPDHRLNDVAIRHWDGYWFGKARLWGDTFPHYWSTLTALALYRHGIATNDVHSAERARQIVRNNFSLFSGDGRASCAFVYPLTVNDQPAHQADAYANDQDWALVHWLIVNGR